MPPSCTTFFDNYGIANTFEIYSGTHVSAVADRFQNHVLPFFSKNLCFTADLPLARRPLMRIYHPQDAAIRKARYVAE